MPPTPPLRSSTRGIRSRHKGRSTSLDKFRKGSSPPKCYDCRSTGRRIAQAFSFPNDAPPPSPSRVEKKKCRKRKVLPRFIDDDKQVSEYEFCRQSNQSCASIEYFTNLQASIKQSSRPQTPDQRNTMPIPHTPPTHSPDSDGLKPVIRWQNPALQADLVVEKLRTLNPKMSAIELGELSIPGIFPQHR